MLPAKTELFVLAGGAAVPSNPIKLRKTMFFENYKEIAQLRNVSYLY